MTDTKKQEYLKTIQITVSPLMPSRQIKTEISDKQKVILNNYRSWAWGMNTGLIMKTGRGR